MKTSYGVTLVELMIVVAIMAILGAIAYPAYTSHVVEARRAESKKELIEIALLQEQFYMDNSQYATTFAALGLGNVTNFATENGFYTMTMTASSVTNTFTVTATAAGSQAASDPTCSWFTLDQDGDKAAEGTDCW